MSNKQTDEYLEQMREIEEEHFETVAKEELWWEQAGWRDVAKHLQNEWEKTFKEVFK